MYSQERICPIEDKQSFEEALREVVESFGEDWLNLKEGHPLQELWTRGDILSSIELFTLGSSIGRIKLINRSRVMDNINIIKKKDQNGRRGATLELILAAALHNPPDQIIELLDPQNPVYDLIVHLKEGIRVNISIKNFGRSEKEDIFIKETKLVEKLIKTNLVNNSKIFIKSNSYPSPYQWDMLKRGFTHVLKRSPEYADIAIDNWHIMLSPLTVDKQTLYTRKPSYTFFMTTPYHKNEKMRLFSKLNDACADLKLNGKQNFENSINTLYAHLPSYVLIDDYSDWCNKYLSINPDVPIASIRLIQPAYAKDSEKDIRHLFILYRDILKDSGVYDGFTSNGRRLINQFPIGMTAGKPFELKFEGSNAKLPLMHYWYQSDHIYLFDEIKGKGSIKHNMRYNYGIHTHSIMRIKGEDLEVSSNFPPTYELLLL